MDKFERNTVSNLTCEVEYLTLERLQELVPEPSKFPVRTDYTTYEGGSPTYNEYVPDRNQDINHRVAITSEDNPAILFEEYATDCTIILKVNNKGDAALMHDSISIQDDESYEKERIWLRKVEEKINNAVEDDAVVFVGGRWAILDKYLWEYDKLLEEVFPDSNLAVMEADNPVDSENGITGVLFIPKYIATDGRNHLLVSTKFDKNDNFISYETIQKIEKYLGLVN